MLKLGERTYHMHGRISCGPNCGMMTLTLSIAIIPLSGFIAYELTISEHE